MIIIGQKYGQLGNRIFLFSHFIGNAIEHGYIVFDPAFDEYSQYFSGTSNDPLIWFPRMLGNEGGDGTFHPRSFKRMITLIFYEMIKRSTWLMTKIGWNESKFHRIIDISNVQFRSDDDIFELNEEKFVKDARRKIVIIKGWLFRDFGSFNAHAEELRMFFQPVRAIRDRVDTELREWKKDIDILIGVHMRQGDYRSYCNGKYFFDQKEYAGIMEKTKELFKGKNVRFLVCSDENVNLENCPFDHVVGPGKMVDDLYALSKCDYIIGTYSTYSMWATFLGNNRMYMILDPKKPIILNDFKSFNELEPMLIR